MTRCDTKATPFPLRKPRIAARPAVRAGSSASPVMSRALPRWPGAFISPQTSQKVKLLTKARRTAGSNTVQASEPLRFNAGGKSASSE